MVRPERRGKGPRRAPKGNKRSGRPRNERRETRGNGTNTRTRKLTSRENPGRRNRRRPNDQHRKTTTKTERRSKPRTSRERRKDRRTGNKRRSRRRETDATRERGESTNQTSRTDSTGTTTKGRPSSNPATNREAATTGPRESKPVSPGGTPGPNGRDRPRKDGAKHRRHASRRPTERTRTENESDRRHSTNPRQEKENRGAERPPHTGQASTAGLRNAARRDAEDRLHGEGQSCQHVATPAYSRAPNRALWPRRCQRDRRSAARGRAFSTRFSSTGVVRLSVDSFRSIRWVLRACRDWIQRWVDPFVHVPLADKQAWVRVATQESSFSGGPRRPARETRFLRPPTDMQDMSVEMRDVTSALSRSTFVTIRSPR